jgi:monoamine oxidase
MGLLNITAIKFPIAFWPKDLQFMFFSQFDDLSISAFFNLHYFIQEPILIGYSGGETARQLENFSDEELMQKTMRNFKKIYGAKIPEPVDYINTRWSNDPFSYGSYSYAKAGVSSDDYRVMANSIANQIFFAGEATSFNYPATTHGAYLSGIREAEKIGNVG